MTRLRSTLISLPLAWLLVVVAVAACTQQDTEVKWAYDGPGAPEYWASLSKEYATCGSGLRQSPIDIAGYERVSAAPVSFSYTSDALAVRNNGRYVQVDYRRGSTMNADQRTYELKSAHLHSPSEHLIEGESFAAELHLVHTDSDGKLAMVGLLFGLVEPNPVVLEILAAAPPVGGEVVTEGIALNAAGYAPGESGHYTYEGSTTTPPCVEPVDWYVMRQAGTVSRQQVDSLLALSGGPNNRPVQPAGDRVIRAVPR